LSPEVLTKNRAFIEWVAHLALRPYNTRKMMLGPAVTAHCAQQGEHALPK